MKEEYIDDEVLEKANSQGINIENNNVDDKIKHITNTKGYDPTRFVVISPEEVMKEHERLAADPNPEFTKILNDVEKSKSRRLTKEEYLKACDMYAGVLAERDAEKTKTYEGKLQINPLKKEQYFRMLLDDKPVTNAAQEAMKTYENEMVRAVGEAYEHAKKHEAKIIEIKENRRDRINLRFKGKCRIASDESGKVVIIDNKDDVNLLRMKYRKEWIDKRYSPVINAPVVNNKEDEDDFV
jgi:N-methylhydantoinase A/oxoprolinase/acetone carboxylase beta subunit